MKIKLNTGEIVDERLNKAQRLIRLGRATVYIAPIKPKKKAKKEKKIEDKTTKRQEYSTEKVQEWGDN